MNMEKLWLENKISEEKDRREEEIKELPENPKRMTYRGRYEHLDKEMMDLVDLKELPKDKTVRFLDFAGGVLSFGSPTAHDIVDKFKESGHQTDISVVDTDIPKEFNPSHPEVHYLKSLEESEGKFDVIRVLHLVEHIKEDEYKEIRKKLIKKLKVGGLFISTQGLARYHQSSEDIFRLDPVIKIMQKRKTKFGQSTLVPIALLPDPIVPWNEGDLSEYTKFREEVRRGEKTIPKVLDEEGFKKVLRHLNHDIPYSLKKLQDETFGVLGEIDTQNSGDIMEIIKENAKDTKKWFIKTVN